MRALGRLAPGQPEYTRGCTWAARRRRTPLGCLLLARALGLSGGGCLRQDGPPITCSTKCAGENPAASWLTVMTVSSLHVLAFSFLCLGQKEFMISNISMMGECSVIMHICTESLIGSYYRNIYRVQFVASKETNWSQCCAIVECRPGLFC